jgi:hypothetical protein
MGMATDGVLGFVDLSSTAIVGILMTGACGSVGSPSHPAIEIDGMLADAVGRGRGGSTSEILIQGIAIGCGGCWFGWLLVLSGVLDGRSGLGSVLSSAGFQLVSKLTIGRPGLSLTAVGSGSLALRSFNLKLVAARISSPRISTPFLHSTSGSSGVVGC